MCQGKLLFSWVSSTRANEMGQVKDFLLTIFSCVVWNKGIYFMNFSNKNNLFIFYIYMVNLCLSKKFYVFMYLWKVFYMYLYYKVYINIFHCIYYQNCLMFQISIYKDMCK
jgi:hypothetical protein